MESSGSQGSGADGGFVDRLPAETRRWQDQGIITAEQAQAIVSTYGLTPGVAAGQRARAG